MKREELKAETKEGRYKGKVADRNAELLTQRTNVRNEISCYVGFLADFSFYLSVAPCASAGGRNR